MSKTHHPDHNPDDPEASSRFVKISEAYATLGNTQKRERYDREFRRASGSHTQQEHRRSHSSSSTPWGSRPASGLSRRRTQFRGPPPSFYRSGGWGAQGAKRHSQADSAASTSAYTASGAAGASGPTANMGGGFGPGQAQAGWDNDVPHFDRDGHYRTQEQQESWRRRRREERATDHGGVPGVWINFVIIGGVVSLASLPLLLFEKTQEKKSRIKP